MASVGTFATMAAAIREEKSPLPASLDRRSQPAARSIPALPTPTWQSDLPPLPSDISSNPIAKLPNLQELPATSTIPLFPPISSTTFSVPYNRPPTFPIAQQNVGAMAAPTLRYAATPTANENLALTSSSNSELQTPKLSIEQPRAIAPSPKLKSASVRPVVAHHAPLEIAHRGEVETRLAREPKIALALNDAVTLALKNNSAMAAPTLRYAAADRDRLVRPAELDAIPDLETARLTERIDALELEATLSNTATHAIFAYRDLLQAQERVEIERLALESAIAWHHRELAEFGQLAQADLARAQAQIDSVRERFAAAQKALEGARSRLSDVLSLPADTQVFAADSALVEPLEMDAARLQQLMFANRPEYLQGKLAAEKAKLSLIEAENHRRQTLEVEANYSEALDRGADLVLSRELSNRVLEQNLDRSRVDWLQAQNRLADLETSLKSELFDRLRAVDLSYAQAKLATEARELAWKNLEIGREHRAGGRSDLSHAIRLHNDLAQARTAELNAIVSYLNARTRLDRTLGNTLNSLSAATEAQGQNRQQKSDRKSRLLQSAERDNRSTHPAFRGRTDVPRTLIQ